MRVSKRRWWPLVAAVLLAGCFGGAQSGPRIELFRLDYQATAPGGSPLPYILRVPPMEVASAYDRDTMVYREGGYQLGSYFYYRWASNPGSMIAELLARDFSDSGLYRDVQTAVSVVRPDFQIKGTVEEIEERLAPHDCGAHLALRITLAANRGAADARIRFSKLYAADEETRCDDPRSLAESMSRVMARLSTEIQADVYAALRQ